MLRPSNLSVWRGRAVALRALVGIWIVGDICAAEARPDRVPLVVLDPGHGGTNLGASSPKAEVCEKRLTLVLAKATARELRRLHPPIRVLLTRYRDQYLSLRARVERANLAQADAFVSIHLNASRSQARRGIETYILNAEASDQQAARLAQRENEGSAGADHRGQLVSTIVDDLRQRAQHGRSLLLARQVQAELMARRPDAGDRGVRQSSFDVLMGLQMPGVLVELGFIDHPVEGQELRRAEVQRHLARGLAKGILAFLRPQQMRGPKAAAAAD